MSNSMILMEPRRRMVLVFINKNGWLISIRMIGQDAVDEGRPLIDENNQVLVAMTRALPKTLHIST